MSKLVITIKHDMDPSNLLDKIHTLDVEMNKLENNIPTNCDEEEKQEIDEMVQANRELREKVTEVSELVKNTLTKINVSYNYLYS